jgi:hypothetical protein
VVRTVYLSKSLDPNSQECLTKPFTDQMMRAFREE